jgi:hypothetical protein
MSRVRTERALGALLIMVLLLAPVLRQMLGM